MFICLCRYVNFPPSGSIHDTLSVRARPGAETNVNHSLFQMSNLTCRRPSTTVPAGPIQNHALQTDSRRERMGSGWISPAAGYRITWTYNETGSLKRRILLTGITAVVRWSKCSNKKLITKTSHTFDFIITLCLEL